jgi:hypothetical protein
MAVQTSSRGFDLKTQWWRVGGILGIGWIILFIVGGFIIQGDAPSRDDSIEEIREYWTEDGETYLLGDYLIALGFTVFFLPYLIILRRVLGSVAGWPELLARIALFGGVIAIIWGGVAGFFWGTLALSTADNPEIDDSALRLMMEIDVYAFAGLVFPLSIFLGAAGLSIALSGVMWRWLGIVAVIAAALGLVSGAWPIDGDEEGALASVGIAAFLGSLLFVLISSIALLMRTETPPLVDETTST